MVSSGSYIRINYKLQKLCCMSKIALLCCKAHEQERSIDMNIYFKRGRTLQVLHYLAWKEVVFTLEEVVLSPYCSLGIAIVIRSRMHRALSYQAASCALRRHMNIIINIHFILITQKQYRYRMKVWIALTPSSVELQLIARRTGRSCSHSRTVKLSNELP